MELFNTTAGDLLFSALLRVGYDTVLGGAVLSAVLSLIGRRAGRASR